MTRKTRIPAPGFQRIVEAEAHHRLAVALVVAVITYGFAAHWAHWPVALIISWDAFALSLLILAWLGMFLTDAKSRVREAHLQDSSRIAICCCVVTASAAGLISAGFLLGSAKGLAGGAAAIRVGLAAATVILSWMVVHTVMALHYAHVFYSPDEASKASSRTGGMEFPEEQEPDFLDFAYFSFVIGMTCQVADVQTASRRVRRIVLLHGLLSFAFNTVIVAFSINLASGLI